MNRRDFLKGSLGLGIGLLLPDLTKAGEVDNTTKSGIDTTKDKVEDILDVKNNKKYEKSISSVGKREVDFFTKFFSLSDNNNTDDFTNEIKSLQKEFGFPIKSQDGVLGPVTLKQIYLEYYSKHHDKLDAEIKKRLYIYNEMLGYLEYPKALYKKLDVFSTNTYYGKDVGINKEGTLINENLFGKVPDFIDKKINKIIILKINGKNVLNFYVDGELYLATYVSPGLVDYKTPSLNKVGDKNPDKYHTSSLYPEVKLKSKNQEIEEGVKIGGAVMPYAVHIDLGIWIHGSDGTINGNPASHGCVRTPIFYVKEIHKKVKELGIKNVIIDTTGIY